VRRRQRRAADTPDPDPLDAATTGVIAGVVDFAGTLPAMEALR
jgi:hypothetical protein